MQVVLDLCYTCYAIYGCSPPSFKSRIAAALDRFMGGDRAVEILRERLRVALSLRLPNVELSECELLNFGFICEVHGDSLYLLNPRNGNLYYRSVQSELGRSVVAAGYEAGAEEGASCRSVRDRTAYAVLALASELGAGQLAVSRDMSAFISRHTTSFPDITVRTYGDYLHLDGLRGLLPPQAQHSLKKVQNLYFRAASIPTSFYRLKLILKAAELCGTRTQALGICYSDGWNPWSEEKWAAVEGGLKSICGISNGASPGSQQQTLGRFDSELYWAEDFITQNKDAMDGSFLERLNLLRPRSLSNHAASAAPSDSHSGPPAVASMPNHPSASGGPNLSQIVQIPPIRIPYSIIVQFSVISRTGRPVRAYIESLSPFTIALLPQYINTYAELPRARGIVTNTACDYRDGLHIILGSRIVARRWCGNTFVECPYTVVEEQGIFKSTDWNFNFRIEFFGRAYTLLEATPPGFYEPRHRERHFRTFVEDIERLNEQL